MREIKFKIWDTIENKFLTLKDYQELGGIEVENDGTFTLSPRFRFLTSMMIMPERFIPLQYTGLKDKNGKEIYEGDIVVNHLYSKEYKSIIKYGVFNVKCCGCCYQYHKVCGFYLEDLNSDEESDIELDENTLDNLEVIGNIYDNKEDMCN